MEFGQWDYRTGEYNIDFWGGNLIYDVTQAR